MNEATGLSLIQGDIVDPMLINISVNSVLMILRPPNLLILPAHRPARLYHVIPSLVSLPAARLPPRHQT
jgi:hypothetical protein